MANEKTEQQHYSALTNLFEKLGVPLVNAITAVRMWHELDDGDAKNEATEYATTLAALLNRTVSLSTSLSKTLELAPTADEKHRLDLAAISSLMIAHEYALMAKVPEDGAISKITSSFESVLSFADYFSSDETMKAKGAKTEDILVDCLEAITPLAQTVGRFAFGKNQKTLITEILDELGKRVNALLSALGKDMEGRDFDLQKMALLKSCAQLLTLCYEEEMNAMLQNADSESINDEKMQQAIARIWKNFDERSDLLRGILGFVNDYFTGSSQDSGKSSAPSAPSASIAKEEKVEEKPAPEQKQDPEEKPEGFNPMSFFSAPSSDEDE